MSGPWANNCAIRCANAAVSDQANPALPKRRPTVYATPKTIGPSDFANLQASIVGMVSGNPSAMQQSTLKLVDISSCGCMGPITIALVKVIDAHARKHV
eukprot:COSAG05_NODE_6743_length_910_cov_1.050555_1_plen_99_part_00